MACEIKNKIIAKSTDMFLKLGFKSVTMDDIASEMCMSKKTIYKYFSNKEILIEQGTEMVREKFHTLMGEVISKNYNAIKENFEIRKMFKEMFQAVDHSPAFQLKKHYPEIYEKMMQDERMKKFMAENPDAQPPFDGKRMVYGGFRPVVELTREDVEG